MKHPGATLDELIETSDIVSLHSPLTPETQNMIDTSRPSRPTAN
jgi:phosphoglycerate dehydrogenase-like enzyme